jgi:exonuclease SbcC
LLQSISLQNFQSHKKTILEFHKGINVITGPSNNGKSSILRALYWTIYNRPSGDSYISHWNRDKNDKPIKSTKVTVINDSGTIERRKGSIKKIDHTEKFNGYIVNDDYLEAIGQDVPDEVTKLFNLDSVNIQKQMDAPFLLSESASEVARFFNSTIRLDLIDKVLAKAESKRRENNKEKSRLENEKLLVDRDILEFAWLDEAEVLANRIEKIENRVNETTDKNEKLIATTTQYQRQLDIIQVQEVILSAVPIVNKIGLVQESLEEKIKKCERLQKLSGQWVEQNTIVEGTADFNLIDQLIIKIDGFRIELCEKVKMKEKLEESIDDYKIEFMKKEQENIKIIELEKQLPKLCPVCEKPLNEKDKCK